MGGLLTRMYLQNTSTQGVNKFISMNTPHFGSQIANVVMNNSHAIWIGGAAHNWEYGALTDLQVNSPAIRSLTAGLNKLKKVPIHTICTDFEITDYMMGHWVFPILTGVALGHLATNDEIRNKLFFGSHDGIVSCSSQSGGLKAPYSTLVPDRTNGAFHPNTPNNPLIHQTVKSLITDPGRINQFTENGLVSTNEKEPVSFYTKTEPEFRAASGQESTLRISSFSVDENRTLTVSCEASSDIVKQYAMVFFENGTSLYRNTFDFQASVDPKTGGRVALCVIGENGSGEIVMDTATIHVPRVINASLYTGAAFDENGTLTLFKGETLQPVMNLIGLNGEIESFTPDQYVSSNSCIEVKDGYITGVTEGSGLLTGYVSGFSAEIPFKVMDASLLEISDGSRVPTSTEPFFAWSKKTEKNFVDFSYSGTNKVATIKLTDDRPATLSIQVFGLDGKMYVSSSEYLSGAHAPCEINLNHLSKGIYIIRVSRENEMNAFKVVI
jgi:hypothetical protein